MDNIEDGAEVAPSFLLTRLALIIFLTFSNGFLTVLLDST